MGLATGPERDEFEKACAQFPELAAARTAFEKQIERFALENAEQPPVGVKVRFLEVIGGEASHTAPSSNQPKIITMENAKSPSRSSGWLRFVAAASVLLLVVAAWYAYRSRTENNDLINSNTVLKTQLDSTHQILQQIIDETRFVKDPNTTVVNMVGTQVAPRSSANVYWDSASTNVFLVVKNMPKLPTDQQYQLWALIDGKPKDLGVFDADSSANDRVILKMKNTQKAQAFAITIEKRGGSPSPTLQKMQSLGKMIQSQ
ncbi:MAG: anti-sigma factor [Bacteroidota bacterium]|nr:anti-sigma factor [Bacteroidota bacterium]MDP4216161.1 anti-sigma factor [Bacteroidota bacterium]MDP4246460.1 anti-sigma factor [Bacteroidota bacterium]MDP4255221.1 anti-sigma factor [Bacteroidota bacterium]MDP4258347.1 anti-sigma factor [Bacteroidota bacterium]